MSGLLRFRCIGVEIGEGWCTGEVGLWNWIVGELFEVCCGY